MRQTLVIIPCGRSKVWDRKPGRGPVPARGAYVGAPFVVNRAYAEHFGDAWIILSAKYGFVPPDVMIPGPYDVTFRRRSTGPVAVNVLRQQILELELDRFDLVAGLGGYAYRTALAQAWSGFPARLVFPFAGQPIGKALRAMKQAVADDQPGFALPERTDDGGA
jgi:hypothetical protein